MPEPFTPSNLPTKNTGEPEDIFSDAEATPNVTPATNVPPSRPSFSPPVAVTPPGVGKIGAEVPVPKGGRKILILVIIIIAVVIIGAGGFLYYWMNREGGGTTITNTENTNTIQNTNQVTNTNQPKNTNSTNTNQPLDSDGDGLTDTEEKDLGTDLKKADTDQDELFDLEEVRVYKTNPNKADTDGDSYLDGAEVKDGYDPNGPGKLRDLEEEINELEQ